MTYIHDENNFPKLIPDENIRFDFKNELKRSSEMDFECSEYEHQCIEAAEEERETDDRQIEKYRKIRLKPDLNLTMPNKHLLKRNSSKILLLRTVLVAAAAAAALALILHVTGKQHGNSANGEIFKPGTVAVKPQTKQDATDNEKQNRDFNDISSTSEDSRISDNTAGKRKREKILNLQHTQEHRQTESDNMLAINNNTLPEQENVEKIREHAKLETINIAFVPPVSAKQPNINILYETKKYKSEGILENLIAMAENSAMDKKIKSFTMEINANKNNIMDVIDNFSLIETLEKIGEKHYVDRYIKYWIKNNKNVPLEIFTDSSFENKMEEYYDENGKMIKAEFYTNLSANSLNKYRNKIIN